jgi:hypothetical protein
MPKFGISMCEVNFYHVLHKIAKFQSVNEIIVSKLTDYIFV